VYLEQAVTSERKSVHVHYLPLVPAAVVGGPKEWHNKVSVAVVIFRSLPAVIGSFVARALYHEGAFWTMALRHVRALRLNGMATERNEL